MTINLPRLGLTAACAALLLAAGACDRLKETSHNGEPAPTASAADTTAADKAVAEAKADTATVAEPVAGETAETATPAPETPPPAEKK